MISLILRKGAGLKEGRCSLSIREHDMGETYYHRIFTLPIELGHRIAAGDNRVSWLFGDDLPGDVAPVKLRFSLRDDPEPGFRLWVCHADTPDGSRIIGYADDYMAECIQRATGGLNFEGGAPDWDRHGLVVKQLRVQSLREEASDLLDEAGRLELELTAEQDLPSP